MVRPIMIYHVHQPFRYFVLVICLLIKITFNFMFKTKLKFLPFTRHSKFELIEVIDPNSIIKYWKIKNIKIELINDKMKLWFTYVSIVWPWVWLLAWNWDHFGFHSFFFESKQSNYWFERFSESFPIESKFVKMIANRIDLDQARH